MDSKTPQEAASAVVTTAAARPSEIVEEMETFSRFDVVPDQESDHSFFNAKTGFKVAATPSASLVHKKIMQEWKILEKNLPPTIYVRVYENRIDLLRAAIVGAAGTPYHDGLFFFDVCFPHDYPNKPPFVHYRSFGVRINPNLYNNGRVCLSLLNTWDGRKSERWNPKESTVLQVLLSIQALVLNEKPYFNEPGLGLGSGRGFWEKKSAAYTEDVFLLSCKMMIWLTRKPPMGFEAFVVAHFRERARNVLAACQAYAWGEARVGYHGVDEPKDWAYLPSVRFKSSMRELYPTLLSSFLKVGALVGDFATEIEDTELLVGDPSADEKKLAKKKMLGMRTADKIIRKLRKLLGLNKAMKKKKTDAAAGAGRWKGEFYSSAQVTPKPPEPIPAA